MKLNFHQEGPGISAGKKESSVAGKIGITLFFLVFFGMGMLFEVLLVREITRNIISRSWSKVSCTILESSVQNDSGSSNPYSFRVKYQYLYQNIIWQSDQFQLQKQNYSDYQAAQKWVDIYPADSESVCFVNPKNPAQVILQHSSLVLAFFIIIPTIFVLVGGGGIYGTWFYKKKTTPDGIPVRQPKGKSKKSGWGLILFGFVFFAAGSGISYPLLVHPLWNSYRARSWIETPCKVISARVQSHDSDDGTTYRVDILYEYIVDDKPYRSNCYDFIGGSSSGYNGKQAIVNRYRNIKEPVCYVNPDNPSDAVLMRNITWNNAFGLIPLIFVAAGLFVMWMGISKIVKSVTLPPDQQWLPQAGNKSHSTSGFQHGYNLDFGDKLVLKPQMPTFYKLVGILFFCLFWNGIVSVFVYQMISGFRSGHPEWCLALFLIPFELVGIGTFVAVIYQFLALFNPRFEVTIEPGNLYPGSDGQLYWTVRGRAGRIGNLSIKLIGREEATYRRGTKTSTDKKAFFEKELICTGQLQEISDGQVRFSIPQETMHSFESDNNKIVWLVQLHGDIARWPDVSQEYKITILPKAIG
jgi:hypothetical protein